MSKVARKDTPGQKYIVNKKTHYFIDYDNSGIDSDLAIYHEVINKTSNVALKTGRTASEIAADLQADYDKRRAKTAAISARRKSFHSSKKDLFIALIKSGAAYECAYCQASDYIAIDHIIPISRGGSDDLENLQFLCRSCNSSKGTS
jgi:5-methylcytosine-specific restriction endonuclease McrA